MEAGTELQVCGDRRCGAGNERPFAVVNGRQSGGSEIMSEVIREAAERLARATPTRRSFLGHLAYLVFAGAAAIAANAAFDTIAAGACGCNPPCGQYCTNFYSGSCNDSTIGCSGSCWQNTSYWAPAGSCWFDGCNRTCCDCWCPGQYRNSSCIVGANFQCGCAIIGVRPPGSLPIATQSQIEAKRRALQKSVNRPGPAPSGSA